MAPATAGDLPVTVPGYGAVQFDPKKTRTLTADLEARVLRVAVQAGAVVEAGDLLVELGPSSDVSEEISRARRDADAAGAVAARMKRLRADGLASDAEVESADTEAQDLIAHATQLERRARSIATTQAPMPGIVDAVLVEGGDLVSPGTPLVRLASPDAIEVKLHVEISDVATIAPGDSVRLTSLDAKGTSLGATVDGIDYRVDPTSRSASVYVLVPQNAGMLPGEAVRAEITTGVRANVVLVPRHSVFLDESGWFLFVAKDGVAELHRVETGLTVGESTEITSGVAAGDTVVVEGGAILTDGMKVRVPQSAQPHPPEGARP